MHGSGRGSVMMIRAFEMMGDEMKAVAALGPKTNKRQRPPVCRPCRPVQAPPNHSPCLTSAALLESGPFAAHYCVSCAEFGHGNCKQTTDGMPRSKDRFYVNEQRLSPSILRATYRSSDERVL